MPIDQLVVVDDGEPLGAAGSSLDVAVPPLGDVGLPLSDSGPPVSVGVLDGDDEPVGDVPGSVGDVPGSVGDVAGSVGDVPGSVVVGVSAGD